MTADHEWDERWQGGLLLELVCGRCGTRIVPVVLIVPTAEVEQVRAQLPAGREVWGMSHLTPGHREIMHGPGLVALTGKPPCVTHREEIGS